MPSVGECGGVVCRAQHASLYRRNWLPNTESNRRGGKQKYRCRHL